MLAQCLYENGKRFQTSCLEPGTSKRGVSDLVQEPDKDISEHLRNLEGRRAAEWVR